MLRESGSWRRCGSSQSVLRVRPYTECQFLTSLREARRSSRRPQISRQFRRSFISQAPLREKRAARVRNVHAVHRIPASTPAAYHSQELATAMPDRDDDPDGAGHSRSRSRMPDLEWLSSSDEGRLPAWISPSVGTCSPHAIMAEAASGGVRTYNG